MEKWKAKRDFAAADDLFQRKKYNEALEVLNRLNREFPNNRRVMMPRALCLAEMGRYHEAATLCEQILAQEDYPRAKHLLKKLKPYLKQGQAPFFEAPTAVDPLLDPTAPPDFSAFGDERPAYAPPLETGGGWGKPLLVSFVIILLAAAIGGGGFYFVAHQKLGRTDVAQSETPEATPEPAPAPVEEPEEPYTPDFSQFNKYADPQSLARAQQQMQAQETPPPAPYPGGREGPGVADGDESYDEFSEGDPEAESEEVDISEEGLLGLGVGLLIVLFVVASVLEFVVLFCTLMLLNKMPRPTLGENLLLIAGVAVASVLISRIPYVGWFASLFMIITVFQLTFVDCLVMILVNAAVMICAGLVFVGIVGASLWTLL